MVAPSAESENAQSRSSWLKRADALALLAGALTLAAAACFILDNVVVAAGLTALAVTAAILAAWAARLERQRAERSEHEAMAARRSNQRFLSVASHDLSQPLHALTLYLAALKKRVSGDDALGVLAKADDAAQAMAAMLAGVTELNRVDAAALTPHLETFPLQEVLDRVGAAQPSVTVPATALRVHSDAALLEQALRHLAANAAQHGRGGRIELSEENQWLEIAVQDVGGGIAPEDHAHIFEPFVRLDSGRRTNGLGLGLTIVRRIANALDLDLQLRSAPGAGARFSLRVPLGS